ncbi:hypothetical protein [Mycobacterium simiae]|uniref:hypothetical protein n=1 Tax=Mycobacterium simiae TaxID=1784 RepID=UPI0026143155|nr:hypothetical protein [Mycobacterium simiae]
MTVNWLDDASVSRAGWWGGPLGHAAVVSDERGVVRTVLSLEVAVFGDGCFDSRSGHSASVGVMRADNHLLLYRILGSGRFLLGSLHDRALTASNIPIHTGYGRKHGCSTGIEVLGAAKVGRPLAIDFMPFVKASGLCRLLTQRVGRTHPPM